MNERTIRAEMLLGAEAMEKLKNAHVAVFGLGGVGSWCAEALARSGVGHLTLIDQDTVGLSNINRQLCALTSTVGMPKADVIKLRLEDINPDADVKTIVGRYDAEHREDFFADYDFIVDCIDLLQGRSHPDGKEPRHTHRVRARDRQQVRRAAPYAVRHKKNQRLSAGEGGAQGAAQHRHRASRRCFLARGGDEAAAV